MLQSRAYENSVYYIFSNAKQTLFINPDGTIEAEGSEGTVTHHTVNLTAEGVKGVWAKWPQRRPTIYQSLTDGADPSVTEKHAHRCV